MRMAHPRLSVGVMLCVLAIFLETYSSTCAWRVRVCPRTHYTPLGLKGIHAVDVFVRMVIFTSPRQRTIVRSNICDEDVYDDMLCDWDESSAYVGMRLHFAMYVISVVSVIL